MKFLEKNAAYSDLKKNMDAVTKQIKKVVPIEIYMKEMYLSLIAGFSILAGLAWREFIESFIPSRSKTSHKLYYAIFITLLITFVQITIITKFDKIFIGNEKSSDSEVNLNVTQRDDNK